MKILIVEDEPSLQDLLQMHLTDYGTCDFASNGVEALAAVEQAFAAEEPYDLICMDIMMPEMDGLEALKKIRQIEFKRHLKGLPSVKVIMITAKDMAKDMIEAFDAGSEAYITKPFTRQRLLNQMHQLGLFPDSMDMLSPENCVKRYKNPSKQR